MALLSVSIFHADRQQTWISELTDRQAVEVTQMLSEAVEKELIEDFDLSDYDSSAATQDLFRSITDLSDMQAE